MAKQSFRSSLGLRSENVKLLDTINGIIEEYAAEGYKMTLRQLYYQLVSQDIIPNRQEEYKKIGNLLVKGRMAGVVDWSAIEDRIRVPYIPYWVRDIHNAINDTINQYRLNRQEGQKNYIEVWVEKDALSGVLSRTTDHYHVHLMVNRGYSSCSAMYDAYERLEEVQLDQRKSVILYLGDHDPSGLDMIRDVENRLEEFGVDPDVVHVAITMKQIKKYNPPPNPAKITDPRAVWYIEKFGNVCWEVDALNPKILNSILEKTIKELIDIELFEAQIIQEKKDKEKLREIIKTVEEE